MANSGSRFTDIDLCNKRLPACYGYLNHEILPLKDVFNDLQTRLPRINEFVRLAVRHCTYPNHYDLTKDESAALYLYTMEMGDQVCVYQMLNEALRLEDRTQVRPWFDYLKLMDAAANKLPEFKGIIWRGVKKDLSNQFKRDQKLTWWTVSSCSKLVNTIQDFLGNTPNSTLFSIECSSGRCISDFTSYPHEKEVILMPGTKLKVVADPLKHKELCIIHLQEILNDESSSDDEASGATASAKPAKSTEKGFSETTLILIDHIEDFRYYS